MRYPYRVVRDENVDRLQVYSRWRHSRAILITRMFTLSGVYFSLSFRCKCQILSGGCGLLGYVTGTEEIVTKQDKILKILKGVYNRGDPPLSIPNREVKPLSADGTALWWESRLAPNCESELRKWLAFFSDIQGRVFSDQSLPSPVNYSVSMVNSWWGSSLRVAKPFAEVDKSAGRWRFIYSRLLGSKLTFQPFPALFFK